MRRGRENKEIDMTFSNISCDMLCNIIFFAAIYEFIWKRARKNYLAKLGLRPSVTGTVIAFFLFVSLMCFSVFVPYFIGLWTGMISPVMVPFASIIGVVIAYIASVRLPLGKPIGAPEARKAQTHNLFGMGKNMSR